jgi:hypothetical protein
MNANVLKTPHTEKEFLSHEADIGFNYYLKAGNIAPDLPTALPSRSGTIVIFQRLEDSQVKTWLLELVVRCPNTLKPFRGLRIETESLASAE